jgi:uncharacterized membrane protein YedE/YeeE
MENFTPLSAAIGGGLIGLSAVLLMLLTGRIAGISGIFGGLLDLGDDDKGWRIAFIAGFILAPLIAGWKGHAMPSPRMPQAGPSSVQPACGSASAPVWEVAVPRATATVWSHLFVIGHEMLFASETTALGGGTGRSIAAHCGSELCS